MQNVVQHVVLTAEPVVTPEGLYTQQVHGEDLTNHIFMCVANGRGVFTVDQQHGMVQEFGVHLFQ
ncbi:hypothetical protein D3C71_1889620 [compost metagenome]